MAAEGISPDVADHESALADTFARSTINGVCVADGFGVRLTVERGALQVTDGIGPHRRVRSFAKATHGLSRVVLTNPYGGYLSWDALRWLSAIGVGLSVVGADGTPRFLSNHRLTDDARLRRQQAFASAHPVGLGIARMLLKGKLDGQARNLREYFGELSDAATVEKLAQDLEGAETVDECRQLEASAANLYFAAWAGHPACSPTFAVKDRPRVPQGWLVYDTRRSVTRGTTGPRKACHPTNALLNYCFGLLEAVTIDACHAVGVDPGLGIVHQDYRGRQSMALDILEPVRPLVEAMILDLLARRAFRKAEFGDGPDGVVSCRAPITHELAELMPKMTDFVAPYAERVAHLLGQAMNGRYTPATPLTRERNKAAQAAVRVRRAGRRAEQGSLRQEAQRLGVTVGRVRYAKKRGVPLAHVEAGLALTGQRSKPGSLRTEAARLGVSVHSVRKARQLN